MGIFCWQGHTNQRLGVVWPKNKTQKKPVPSSTSWNCWKFIHIFKIFQITSVHYFGVIAIINVLGTLACSTRCLLLKVLPHLDQSIKILSDIKLVHALKKVGNHCTKGLLWPSQALLKCSCATITQLNRQNQCLFHMFMQLLFCWPQEL